MTTRHYGFNLLELTIVVAIISILVAGAMGYYQDRTEASRQAKMKNEMETFLHAAVLYYTRFSSWPEKLTDLVGNGLVKVPLDPWGGEYTIENRYYITCRSPNGGPYRLAMCPRILYNMFASGWAKILPVNPVKFKELKDSRRPFKALMYTEITVDGKVIEYVSTLDSYSSKGDYSVSQAAGKGIIYAVYHEQPDMVYHGLPIQMEFDGNGAPTAEQNQILREKWVRTIYKYLMSQGRILWIYYHEFGEMDGDVDLDGRPEFRIEYADDTMIVYDLNEAIGGLNADYIEKKIHNDIERGGIYYDIDNIMMYWDRSYFAHWSVW